MSYQRLTILDRIITRDARVLLDGYPGMSDTTQRENQATAGMQMFFYSTLYCILAPFSKLLMLIVSTKSVLFVDVYSTDHYICIRNTASRVQCSC